MAAKVVATVSVEASIALVVYCRGLEMFCDLERRSVDGKHWEGLEVLDFTHLYEQENTNSQTALRQRIMTTYPSPNRKQVENWVRWVSVRGSGIGCRVGSLLTRQH